MAPSKLSAFIWNFEMSALGQRQTFAVQKGMSALPPKAAMCSATRDVRFVPIADIAPFTRAMRRRAAKTFLELQGLWPLRP